MRIVECSESVHTDAILDILNHAILNSTAIYDYAPRPRDSMQSWFETKRVKNFPVIGAVDTNGDLLGFASYGGFRANPAYKYTVEHSVYVRHDRRGAGLGVALMQELIGLAKERDVHVLVGGIDMANQASIRLHEKLGFTHSGIIRQAGFKFGRWLDLGFYQLALETPLAPVDG